MCFRLPSVPKKTCIPKVFTGLLEIFYLLLIYRIFQEIDFLLSVVFTCLEMTCESHIELSYYSTTNSIGKQPGLCCYCAAQNIPRDPHLVSRYKTVLPICEECKLVGYELVCMRPFGKRK